MLSEIVKRLIKEKKYGSLFVLARYMYRIGEPVLGDTQYNLIEESFKKNEMLKEHFAEYLNRTYDDDPVPYDLLHSLGLEEYIEYADTSDYASLNEDKSLSIKPIDNYTDTFVYFASKRSTPELEIIFSGKGNGVNTKNKYKSKNFGLSLSRGRNGNSFDFSKTITKVIPTSLAKNGVSDEVVVYAEALVETSYLERLRDKYCAPNKYKTEKSSAISLLRVVHDNEDYKHLKVYAFAAEGLATTISGNLEVLKESGFDVVPYRVVKIKDVPSDFEEYKKWLHGMMTTIWDECQAIGLATDGMVVDVNDIHYENKITNQYSDRNMAVKFEYWSSKYYKGIVKDVIIEQQRVNASFRVQIQPLIMGDGCEATYVNVFNANVLITEGILPGSEVYFERKSETTNVMIHGERLRKLLNGV